MFVKLIRGEQTKLIKAAIEKAGSEKNFSKLLDIPEGSVYHYKLEKRLLPLKRFKKITAFLKINKESIEIKELPSNWGQRIGGKKCVISKKKKGTFNIDMKRLQQIQSEKLKKWHRHMRLNNPEKYYELQYSRFKKIGGYKYRTKSGGLVRNKFEKDVADILERMGVKYQYEPLVKINKNFYFPDFLINNSIIIECTAWKGVQKAYKLKNKIEDLKKEYCVFVVIPKNLYSYYKVINNDCLILGLDNFASVAQTFHKTI